MFHPLAEAIALVSEGMSAVGVEYVAVGGGIEHPFLEHTTINVRNSSKCQIGGNTCWNFLPIA